MPSVIDIRPDILKKRHHLTSFQVNSLFRRIVYSEAAEEKAAEFETVKEFLTVAAALSGAGIKFIPLKGPVLSFRLYGDPTGRQYSDLDILVGSDSLQKAVAVLEGLGYRAEDPGWPEDRRQQRVLIRHAKDIAFVHPEKGIVIELHWRLFKNLPLSSACVDSILNENKTELFFAGQKFTVLSDEMELLFLVIHGAIHWWRRLKWAVDVNAFLLTKRIDTEKFLSLVDEFRAARLVSLCNAIMKEYFPDGPLMPETRPASSFHVRFSLRMIQSQKEISNDFYTRILQSVRYALFSFPGFRYKLRTVRNYLFVAEYFGKNRFFSSVPLFYFYGSARLAIKRFREWN